MIPSLRRKVVRPAPDPEPGSGAVLLRAAQRIVCVYEFFYRHGEQNLKTAGPTGCEKCFAVVAIKHRGLFGQLDNANTRSFYILIELYC